MNLQPFTGGFSTPARRAYFKQLYDAAMSVQKIDGANVHIDHQPEGSIINVTSRAGKNPIQGGGPAVCPSSDTITVVFDGISFDCGCVFGTSGQFLITDTGVNRSCVLNKVSDVPCIFSVELFGAGPFSPGSTVADWSQTVMCGGAIFGPAAFDHVSVTLYVGLFAPSDWTLIYLSNSGTISGVTSFFIGRVNSSSLPGLMNNIAVCNTDVGVGAGICGASGGTAALS